MIHVIMGTKGQFIKKLPILKELDRKAIPYNFVDAAQHVDITRILTAQFDLKRPDHVLANVNKDISTVPEILWRFAANTVRTLLKKKESFPEGGVCLVHGDAPPAMLGLVMAKLAGLLFFHQPDQELHLHGH